MARMNTGNKFFDGLGFTKISDKPFFGLVDVVKNWIKKSSGSDLTTAEIAQQQYQTGEREAAQDFEERMSNTAHQRAVADMRAAGLNTALMYGAGASGASTPSSSGMSAVSSGGASMSEMFSAVLSSILGFKRLGFDKSALSENIRLKEKQQDIERFEAETHRKEVEKKNEDIDEDIKRKRSTFELFVESQRLANDVLRGNVHVSEETCKKLAAECAKLAEETKSEPIKRLVFAAEARLKNAQASEIVALLPFRQRLMSAQTAEAKAGAVFQIVSAARAQKLVDSGEVDLLIRDLTAKVTDSEARAALDRLHSDMRLGRAIDTSDMSWFGKIPNEVANGIIGGMSNFVDLIGSALGSVINKAP